MARPTFDIDPEKHAYSLDGEIYPSVTQIISSTVPKQLAWWGMQVACEGVAWLINNKHVEDELTGEQLVSLLTEHRKTTNHKMYVGAHRGKEIHDALAKYAETGNFNLADFSIKAKPYARGLMKFLIENDPEITESEVITGSIEYKYAGTFDAKARLRRGKYAGAYVLLDAKTGKRVYPDQHFPQLEAYEQAEVESGENPTDFRAVLHLNENSNSVLTKSVDSFKDFKVLLDHWKSVEERKARLKQAKLEAKVEAASGEALK